MAMFENHMLKNASNVTINNSSLNIGASAKQLAHKKLSKAAAHSALHDAPARTDKTRCHRNTRVDILNNLERWAQGIFEAEASLFWLYGGAGAGKSAIVQTLSERCAAQKLALGSFFFSRSDPTRNTAMALIPTLAYQVAQLFPDALNDLYQLINRDSLIFKKSLQVQLIELLVQPLKRLVQLEKISDASPRVFLIDGLDECDNTDSHQQEIIRAVAAVCHEHHIPVKFLIASRPELHISASFRSHKQANRPLGSISLSEDPNAETDIQRYVKDEFVKICLQHPFRDGIPSGWPHFMDITALVEKSSSHFIFASTTMKYIWSAKENPVRSLQVLLGLEVSRTGSPFAYLDALYQHIFQSAGHCDQVLQILAHCLFSSLPSYASIICIIHEYSLRDFYIFVADMTPLVTISLPWDPKFGVQEVTVKLLHASLGDFLRDPARSGSLHLDKPHYLASKLGRCIQLLDLYSQNQATEPEWPHTQMYLGKYRHLYSEIHETIRLSGNLDAVQGVLSRISLPYLDNCGRLLSLEIGWDHPYRDCISEILLAICESQTPTGFSKRYMEEFLDILESAMKSDKTPLGSIILPLIFLGYPTLDLTNIYGHHFQNTPKGSLLTARHRGQLGTAPLFMKVVECIAISDPSIRHRRANLSPGHLAAAIEAILDYRAPSLANSWNAESCPLCTVPRENDPHLDAALMWLLPTAGFSQKIITFSKRNNPYLCKAGPCSELQKRLDEYNVRVRNEGLNLGKNTSQFLPSFNSERSRSGSVPRMRAQERESKLRTPFLHVADLSDNHNLQEGETRTRKGDLGVLNFERNRDNSASKSGDCSGSVGWIMSPRGDHSGSGAGPLPLAGHTTRHGASRYNPEYSPHSSQVGHSEVGAVIGASSPRMGNRKSPRSGSRNAPYGQNHQEISERPISTAPISVHETFGQPTHKSEREREREEVRALREQHAIEMKALRSQLEDSLRTNNILKEENGRLRSGLDRVVEAMREIESLKQACTRPEVDKSRLLYPTTRD